MEGVLDICSKTVTLSGMKEATAGRRPLCGRKRIITKDNNGGSSTSFTSLNSDDEAERYTHRRLRSIIESRVILCHHGTVVFLSLGNPKLRFAGPHSFLAFGSHSPRPDDAVNHFAVLHS